MAPPQNDSSTEKEFEILDDGNELLWKEWADQVRSENWTSDDNSVLALTPILPSTRAVFATTNNGKKFLGCVVWNEYDGLAFIGFYLVHPSMRGKGVGSVIWKRAIERIPKDHIIGLRAVQAMAENYKKRDTPVEYASMDKYTFNCQQMTMLCQTIGSCTQLSTKSVRDFSDKELQKLENFDKRVTGRDRSYFLRLFFNVPLTEGVVAFDENGNIVAYAAVTSTSFDGRNLFKVAPIYASNIQQASSLLQHLLQFCINISMDSQLLLHFLTGTIGEELIAVIKDSIPDLVPVGPTRTMFSQQYSQLMDNSMCFVPHNNSGHYDA